jgi:hypothetical protein
MSRNRLAMLSIVALLACSSTAAAQGQRGRGRGFGMSAEAMRLGLLSVPKVQEDLKLDSDQKSKIQAIAEQNRSDSQSAFADLQNATQEERQKKFAELQEKSKARGEEAAKLLTKEQSERLDQISLQALGVRALADEKVAKSLELTGEQKEKLQSINAEVGTKMREIGFGEGTQEKRAELQKELTDKSMAVLSDGQRSQFAKMQGEKLDLPPGAGFGFGGGGRRRPQ